LSIDEDQEIQLELSISQNDKIHYLVQTNKQEVLVLLDGSNLLGKFWLHEFLLVLLRLGESIRLVVGERTKLRMREGFQTQKI